MIPEFLKAKLDSLDKELLLSYLSMRYWHYDPIWEECGPYDEGMGYERAIIIREQFHQIARHFYELGKNAK